MLKGTSFIICLTGLLSGICTAAEINLKTLDKQNWTNIETANFSVLTDARESQAVEIVRELEDFKYFCLSDCLRLQSVVGNRLGLGSTA